jgi:hypothetical protein
VSGTVPDRAQRLAAELELRFADDARIATQLNDAHQRLRRANDRLWWGLHPDGMAAVYGEHPAAVEVAFARNRSEILGAPDPIREAQHVHWTIHHAFHDYQTLAERRRQLTAQIGELAREFVTTLVAAGWSEQDAREADVHKLANPGEGSSTGEPEPGP